MTKGLASIGPAAVLALVLAAFSVPVQAQSAPEKLYKAKCASCHATDGSGNTPIAKKLGVHDFRSPEIQKQTDAELIEITAKGKNKMPAYEKSLKPEQIKELVAYIREMMKKK